MSVTDINKTMDIRYQNNRYIGRECDIPDITEWMLIFKDRLPDKYRDIDIDDAKYSLVVELANWLISQDEYPYEYIGIPNMDIHDDGSKYLGLIDIVGNCNIDDITYCQYPDTGIYHPDILNLPDIAFTTDWMDKNLIRIKIDDIWMCKCWDIDLQDGDIETSYYISYMGNTYDADMNGFDHHDYASGRSFKKKAYGDFENQVIIHKSKHKAIIVEEQ